MASLNQSIIEIDNILSHKAAAVSLSEILSSVGLNNYEKATTKYRKPCYQRGLKKSIEWGKMLVESVLEGMSIGSLHLSQWNVMKPPDGDEASYVDSFCNIEDGQTRLNSLLEFKEGKFDTKYGSYEDINVRQIFDSYQVSVVLLSKNHPRVRDEDYFKRLNENFSRLQDGTALTPSDRYWAWYESKESNFMGSPLVNLTVGLVKDKRFKELFQDYMKVNIDRRDNRKELANMIALVSGAWKGAEYSNMNYFSHVDIIQESITLEDKEQIESILFDIQDIIRNVLEEKCKYSGERLGEMFKTSYKFMGSMIIDIKSDEEKQVVAERWKTFINEYREYKEAGFENNWLNDIYKNISDGHRRNCKKEDFEARLDAVKKWWVSR